MNQHHIESFTRRSPGKRLGMLHRLTMSYLAAPLKELGIPKGRIGFLMTLFQYEGIAQEELTNHMCIDRAATARVLQAMETEGLIRREEDPNDRRKKLVYPTDAARALQSGLMDALAEQNAALFAGLNQDEQNQFLAMLDRMVANMRTAVEGADR